MMSRYPRERYQTYVIVPREELSPGEKLAERITGYTRIGVKVKGFNDTYTYEKRSWDRDVERGDG